MRSGAPVAQGPLRYYQGTPLLALFHSKGPQVSRGPVAHSVAVNQAPSLVSGAPSAPKGGPADSGALANWFVPPPHSKYLPSPLLQVKVLCIRLEAFGLKPNTEYLNLKYVCLPLPKISPI